MPGDQFAILFNGDKPKRDILPFTERCAPRCPSRSIMRPQEIFLTASIGVVGISRQAASTAEGLVKDAADRAL